MQNISIVMLLVLLLLLNETSAQTDRFGGWTEVQGPTTDFFTLTVIKDRHTLMTPNGHPYFPLGINHMSAYNKPMYSEVTEFQHDKRAKRRMLDDIQYLNMNSAGGDCPDIMQDQLPFFVTISLTSNAHWLPASRFEFQDVFDPKFIESLKSKIKQTCLRYKDNPHLIGYYWTDTPRWDVRISRNRHLKDWVSTLRNLDEDAAGKKAYVTFLKHRYGSIEHFNLRYGLDFQSFEALLAGRFDHIDIHQPYLIEDDTDFLGVIAHHLYRVASETIRQYDPNHLILGEKYIAGDHPQPVLKAAAQYVDVISIQPGPQRGPGPGPGEEESQFNQIGFKELFTLTGKPILICDHTVSFYSKENPVTLWHQYASQQLAGESQSKYIMQVAKTPYIIGYMNCQYLDAYDPSRGLLKQGLLAKNGKMHQPYADLIKQANNEALHWIRNELTK